MSESTQCVCGHPIKSHVDDGPSWPRGRCLSCGCHEGRSETVQPSRAPEVNCWKCGRREDEHRLGGPSTNCTFDAEIVEVENEVTDAMVGAALHTLPNYNPLLPFAPKAWDAMRRALEAALAAKDGR